MADVKDHLDRMQDTIEMLKIVNKLMLSSVTSAHFEMGKHGPVLINTFSGMMLVAMNAMEDELKNIDLAISIKGHQNK